VRVHLDPRYAILGLIEGIILALGLGARGLFDPNDVNVGNAILNAGVLAAVINLITSFSTELYQERATLLEMERKMVISQRGKYFHTALYRAAQLRTLGRAVSYSLSALAGAATLLVPVHLVPHSLLVGLLVPLLLLFALGLYLGRSTAGSPAVWGTGMVLAGVIAVVVGRILPV
jgi:predicted membrane protein (TIGR00267 family)